MSFSIPSGPARIVCLTEEPTEILYALGEQARIVGISAYTERPPEAKRDKPVVSAFIDGSLKKIQALEPDLVIGFSDIQADLARKLIANNLNVLIFNQRSIQEILEVIVDVGRLVGRAASAQDLVSGYISGLEAAQGRAAKRGVRPRVYFEEWPDPMISAIEWVSELIEIAGGQDIFSDRSRGKLAKERFVQPEEVIAAAPEVMLASWCGKPFEPETVLAREGWGDIPALKTGRVHEIASAEILQPGPACLTAGLAAIERSLIGAVDPSG
jgi:iron complex transport system substrate-binding protein